MSIFVITRLHKLLPIVSTEQEALEQARAMAEEMIRRTGVV